jgi:exopolysaccharide biosynthesis polyprenyl glycosylphosphotransferase
VLSHSRQNRILLFKLCDGALFAVALGLAYLLRATFPLFDLPQIETFHQHLWLFPVFALIGPLTLSSQGFYQELRLNGRLGTIWIVMRGAIFSAIALISILFLVRTQFARSVIILACGFGGLLVYLRHEWLVRFMAARRSQNAWRHRVLWVGAPRENERLRSALSTAERDQLESVGEFDPGTETVGQLVRLLHEHSVNAVIVNLAGIDNTRLQFLLSACEREGVSVIVRPGFFARSPFGMTVDWFAGEPVIHYNVRSAPASHLVVKQILDTALSAALLLLISPLLLLIALAVKLSSPGPVLFRQQRAGLNGRPFQLLKFRSMSAGAEQQQSTLAPHNEMTGPVFKISRDPRVTPLGRFLRRHSLDELPQLWNVLRGEMSLVGPRPLPTDEVKKFSDDAHRRRLSVRPGLTCLWQISGRNDISAFEDWVRLDLAYIDQWSLWLDFKILLGTIPVVIFGRGGR